MSINLLNYVLESGKWIQSDKLYPHDIALILDPSEKKIYLWEGYRATTQSRKDAIPYINEIKEKYSSFAFEELKDSVPLKVQAEIDKNLDHSFEEIQKIDRDPSFNAFLIGCYLCFAGLLIEYLYILGIWTWPIIQGVIFQVPISDYQMWIKDTSTAVISVLILFEILLVFAILTKKTFLIMTAAVGALLQLGTYRYILLDEFLFDFKAIDGGLTFNYYIFVSDGVMFTFLNLLALATILIPMIISIKAIYEQTIPIGFNEWREKKKRAYEIELVKVSAYLEPSSSTPIPDPRQG